MPEYRRFISYFYEYIDGKKQRNTGFAKVELRNGVWRVLFRLTVPVQPEPPVEVFGFMREGEKLTGFPMGTMRAAKEMTEEWAYRADRPVWAGKYGLSDISGLWIQSGDGRCFATVWDDEPVAPARFVKYGTRNEEPAENMENMPEAEDMKPDNADIGEMRNMERASEPAKSGEDMPGVPDNAEKMSEWPGGKGEISGQSENESEALEFSEDKRAMPGGAGKASEWPGSKREMLEQSKVLEFSGNEGEIPKQSEDCSNIENVSEQPDDAGKISELSESRRCVFKQLEDMGKTSKLIEENREPDAEWHQEKNLTGQETEADLGPGNDEAESKMELEKNHAENPKMPQMMSLEVMKTGEESPDDQQKISSGQEQAEPEPDFGDEEESRWGTETSALEPAGSGEDISELMEGEDSRLRGTSALENKNAEDRGTWKEETVTESKKQGSRNSDDDRLWRDLYRKRAAFQPFSDQEISSCIRVVPGDIVVLQNAHWRTGRNNFLLHGYHNYRHLLIGKNSDGGYVLGVPGIMNPQEKYMAAMFGFPDFKYADNQEGNPSFGYWYRPLRREDQ